jgi:hypothetical protein
MSIWSRKKKRKSKKKGIAKKLQGIIIISPWLMIVFNAIMMLLFYLILPKEAIIARWGLLFILMLVLNGWFLCGLLITYLFRDQSQKFICPTFNAPLGEDEGFVTIVPPIYDKNGKMIEPEYVIRAVGGFEALYVYSRGKVLVAYPRSYEIQMGKGGIVTHCWLRLTTVDRVAKNVRDALVLQGVAEHQFQDGNTEIWFGRTVYNVGEAVPNQELIHYDSLMDEREGEINRLKAIVGEKDYQVERYEQGKSLEAYRSGPADEDFRERYNRPAETVRERSAKTYEDDQEARERRRRRGDWG